MIRVVAVVIFIPVLMLCSSIAFSDGASSYAVCSACHGSEGEGNVALNSPSIAGQENWYIARQLSMFKEGSRGTANGDTYGMQMRPMAMMLSAEDIQAVADYISLLPVKLSEPGVTGDVTAGQQAYAICAACHGPKAEGMQTVGGPKLAGQNDWYLVRQITNFQKDLRGYADGDHYGRQMKPMVASLTNEQMINDLVAYINTLATSPE